MNPNDQNMNDQQAFNELLRDDRFDDSANEQHQVDLRAKMLQAFDAPDANSAVVELHSDVTDERRRAGRRQSLGWAVLLALCLTGLVAAWIYSGGDSSERRIVDVPQPQTDEQLVASLEEVNEFSSEVPPEALFNAIAMCQMDYEGRELLGAFQP